MEDVWLSQQPAARQQGAQDCPGGRLAAGLRLRARSAVRPRHLTSPGLRYVVRRVLLSIPVVLGVVVVTFLLLRLIPGDPARTLWAFTRRRRP